MMGLILIWCLCGIIAVVIDLKDKWKNYGCISRGDLVFEIVWFIGGAVSLMVELMLLFFYFLDHSAFFKKCVWEKEKR